MHLLCYPLAGLLWITVVSPYRVLRRRAGLARIAQALPLKAYVDYPFGVLVNDQFDRFSAPIERRFRRDEVEAMMKRAGLEDVRVLENAGWIGCGQRPSRATALTSSA